MKSWIKKKRSFFIVHLHCGYLTDSNYKLSPKAGHWVQVCWDIFYNLHAHSYDGVSFIQTNIQSLWERRWKTDREKGGSADCIANTMGLSICKNLTSGTIVSWPWNMVSYPNVSSISIVTSYEQKHVNIFKECMKDSQTKRQKSKLVLWKKDYICKGFIILKNSICSPVCRGGGGASLKTMT